jgi:hypothetical protein
MRRPAAGSETPQQRVLHSCCREFLGRDERIVLGDGEFHDRKLGNVLHPDREPRQALDQVKSMLGSLHFQAQYQQSPVPETGNLVQRDWFRWYELPPPRTSSPGSCRVGTTL